MPTRRSRLDIRRDRPTSLTPRDQLGESLRGVFRTKQRRGFERTRRTRLLRIAPARETQKVERRVVSGAVIVRDDLNEIKELFIHTARWAMGTGQNHAHYPQRMR